LKARSFPDRRQSEDIAVLENQEPPIQGWYAGILRRNGATHVSDLHRGFRVDLPFMARSFLSAAMAAKA
jgi:hypothetical protein